MKGWLTALCFAGISCGMEEQQLRLRTPAPEQNTSDAEPARSVTIDWQWDCDFASADQVITFDEPNLTSLGDHRLDSEHIRSITLELQGPTCAPQTLFGLRDVLIGIEASSAMADLDPLVDGSCGRLRALEAALDRLPSDRVRASVFLYSSYVYAKTNGYFTDMTLLKDKLAGRGGDLAAQVCGTTGAPDLDLAMQQAAWLGQNFARANEAKEYYLITSESYRAPDDETLTLLQSQYRTVFVMTGDANSWASFASSDRDGNKQTYGVNNDTLQNVLLAAIAETPVPSARIRTISHPTQEWLSLEQTTQEEETVFSQTLDLDTASAPLGVELRLGFVDRKGQFAETYHSTLDWPHALDEPQNDED